MSKFKFSRLHTVGAPIAEEDAYLLDCFVDNGTISVLADCNDARRILLGRTGSGKSALLRVLEEEHEHAISIPPEGLALPYVANSTIIRFVTELGVHLDIFYKLLWRHVLVVEILRYHFKLTAENTPTVLDRLSALFDGKKRKALKYLKDWGSKFWEDTEHRIREVTTTLETKLGGAITGSVSGAGYSADAARAMSETQRADVVQRAQAVVNNVQMAELTEIIALIDDVLDDPQKPYFLLIDGLDEDWVNDDLRYRLIRALIETSRDFSKVRNAKVIIALRDDLLDSVVRTNSAYGFQREKYKALYLPVVWKRHELSALLDKRVGELIRRQYIKESVEFRDVLPKSMRKKGEDPVDYILDRTLLRPRDAISFLNAMLAYADGKTAFTAKAIRDAESEYSRLRLEALYDEWRTEYPSMETIARKWFWGGQTKVSLEDFDESACDALAAAVFERGMCERDRICSCAARLCEPNSGYDWQDFRCDVLSALFMVGLIGYRSCSHSPRWAIVGDDFEAPVPGTTFLLHPTFVRGLACVEGTN